MYEVDGATGFLCTFFAFVFLFVLLFFFWFFCLLFVLFFVFPVFVFLFSFLLLLVLLVGGAGGGLVVNEQTESQHADDVKPGPLHLFQVVERSGIRVTSSSVWKDLEPRESELICGSLAFWWVHDWFVYFWEKKTSMQMTKWIATASTMLTSDSYADTCIQLPWSLFGTSLREPGDLTLGAYNIMHDHRMIT